MLGLRVATAAVLLAAFIVAVLFSAPWAWRAVCLAGLLVAAWEWSRLCRHRPWTGAAFCGVAAALYWWLSGRGDWLGTAAAVMTLLWIVAVPVWLWRRPATADAVTALAGLGVLPVAFAALVELRVLGPGTLFAILAIVWVSDTAAYFTGHNYGRHKLAAAISPGKTWEGVWGALVAVAAYAAVLWSLAPGILPPGARAGLFIVDAVALAVLGILGDLFESQMKRRIGVKDSGRALPGHGGVLDRIDALLPVLPAAWWLFGQ